MGRDAHPGDGYVRLFLLDDDQEQDESLAGKVVVEGDVAGRLRLESLLGSRP